MIDEALTVVNSIGSTEAVGAPKSNFAEGPLKAGVGPGLLQ